jgi:hypothetical protein
MSKIEWEALQVKFQLARKKTGVSVKRWCEQQKLTYATARRYIKISNPLNSRGAPLGSQNAIKHGGYSNCFYNELGQRVEANNAKDELLLCRTRIHVVMSNVVKIQRDIEKNPSIEIMIKLYDSLFLADLAIEKNVARIQSITRRISTRRLIQFKNRINY